MDYVSAGWVGDVEENEKDESVVEKEDNNSFTTRAAVQRCSGGGVSAQSLYSSLVESDSPLLTARKMTQDVRT